MNPSPNNDVGESYPLVTLAVSHGFVLVWMGNVKDKVARGQAPECDFHFQGEAARKMLKTLKIEEMGLLRQRLPVITKRIPGSYFRIAERKMKTEQLKNLVKSVIKEWQTNIVEEKVPGTVYLDDLGIKYSPDEKRVMQLAINTFTDGGHAAPDDENIVQFGRDFVLQCLKKGEKLLARNPKYAKDLVVVKALIPKLSKNPIKKEDSAEFKDGITNNMKAVNLGEVKNLSVPEKHQLRIALQTLKMNDAMVGVMGGMNKEEARAFLKSKGYSDQQIQKLEGGLNEMSTTGGVAGYMTPNAFTKNKKGSPRGIAAAKKYGKVVGEAPRV